MILSVLIPDVPITVQYAIARQEYLARSEDDEDVESDVDESFVIGMA